MCRTSLEQDTKIKKRKIDVIDDDTMDAIVEAKKVNAEQLNANDHIVEFLAVSNLNPDFLEDVCFQNMLNSVAKAGANFTMPTFQSLGIKLSNVKDKMLVARRRQLRITTAANRFNPKLELDTNTSSNNTNNNSSSLTSKGNANVENARINNIGKLMTDINASAAATTSKNK